MKINEIMKQSIKDHKNKIELTQWAIFAGVSSLVYSEFIRRIKHRSTPVKVVMVPEIKTIMELLHQDGDLMQRISAELIDRMIESPLFQKFKHAPELVLFNEDNVEILKTIVDLYMIHAMGRHIAETVAVKFRLNDPEHQSQLIREDNTLDLFHRQPIPPEYFQFIVDQCVLQLLILIPTMQKQIEIPDDNKTILVGKHEVLTINNDNAICPIHFDKSVFHNKEAMSLLAFATSTKLHIYDHTKCDAAAQRPNGMIVDYSIETSPFNNVVLTTFDKIVEETGA